MSRLDALTDADLDALCRGRITRWHTEHVSAGQLQAYLEAADDWAQLPTTGYRHNTSSEVCTLFEPTPVRWRALETLAYAEGRGELAVWLDVREVDT